jgi:hypothetical protein
LVIEHIGIKGDSDDRIKKWLSKFSADFDMVIKDVVKVDGHLLSIDCHADGFLYCPIDDV